MYEKSLWRQKGAGSLVSSQKRSDFRPADKPQVQCGFCSSPVYIVFRLFVLLKRLSEQVWPFLGEPVFRRTVLLGPAPPCISAVRAPSRRACGVSETKGGCRPSYKPLVNRGYRSSVDLHRNSLVRASEESFRIRTVVFDALEIARVGYLLGEPTRRRPVLPGPAPPCCLAVRCPALTRPWYVRALGTKAIMYSFSNDGVSYLMEFACSEQIYNISRP